MSDSETDFQALVFDLYDYLEEKGLNARSALAVLGMTMSGIIVTEDNPRQRLAEVFAAFQATIEEAEEDPDGVVSPHWCPPVGRPH